jgi:hypothetical protein
VLRAARQAEREDRALARLACHGHIAAHHARELAGDRKAEPSAAEALSLVSATALTLILLPILYYQFGLSRAERRRIEAD